MATHSSILAWGISMDCIVHGVAKSWIQLSNFHFTLRGHSTGKGQVLFQSQRRAMPKNIQATVQLCSFHMLVRLCSKSFKLGFSSMQTKNFQMYKLSLEKAKEPEIKLPTIAGSLRKQKNSRKTSASFTKDFVWITTNCRKFLEMGMSDHITCLLRNLYADQEATIRTGHGATKWFKIGKGIQ